MFTRHCDKIRAVIVPPDLMFHSALLLRLGRHRPLTAARSSCSIDAPVAQVPKPRKRTASPRN